MTQTTVEFMYNFCYLQLSASSQFLIINLKKDVNVNIKFLHLFKIMRPYTTLRITTVNKRDFNYILLIKTNIKPNRTRLNNLEMKTGRGTASEHFPPPVPPLLSFVPFWGLFLAAPLYLLTWLCCYISRHVLPNFLMMNVTRMPFIYTYYILC